MKRRNFLKAIGIGAVIAPAVVKAGQTEFKHEEYSLPLKSEPTGNLWTVPNQKISGLVVTKEFEHKIMDMAVINGSLFVVLSNGSAMLSDNGRSWQEINFKELD